MHVYLNEAAMSLPSLQHASQRESDRELRGRSRCGIECSLEMSRRLRVSRVRLGEAEFEEDEAQRPALLEDSGGGELVGRGRGGAGVHVGEAGGERRKQRQTVTRLGGPRCGDVIPRRRDVGPPADQVADALAGRAPASAVLGGLPASTRAALSRLADEVWA